MNHTNNKPNPLIIAALAVLLLAIPVGIRYLWFYQGDYQPQKAIVLPEYSELEMPQPELTLYEYEEDPVPSGSAEVLFDISHGNLFSISELETLTNLINRKGGRLNVTEYYGDLAAELKKADSFVVIAPTLAFTNSEMQAVHRFVARGGRLLVITDPTRNYGDVLLSLDFAPSGLGNVEIVNLLVEPFGLAFSNDYLYNLVNNEGNFRNVIFTDISDAGAAAELNIVVFYGAHSLKNAPVPLLIGDENTFTSLTDQGGIFTAAGSDVEGRVLALGDMTFMTPPYHQVADNARLIENIADFLSGETRQRTLADFPYVFSRPVTLLVDGEEALSQEFLTAIAGAQQSMERLGLELNIASEPEIDSDLIAFGVYPPDEALIPFLEPFELSFSESLDALEELDAAEEPQAETSDADVAELLDTDAGEELDLEALLAELDDQQLEEGPTVDVPGFGKIKTAGIGLILFDDNGSRSTVILLADTQENLMTLSSSFYSGSLESCIIKSQIAVCLLDEESGSLYWEEDFDDYSDEYYPEYEYSDETDAVG